MNILNRGGRNCRNTVQTVGFKPLLFKKVKIKRKTVNKLSKFKNNQTKNTYVRTR